MMTQVFRGYQPQAIESLMQEGKIFTIKPFASDGRSVVEALSQQGLPLRPVAQVVDETNTVRGFCFVLGNGIELSETGAGYQVLYQGQPIMTLRGSSDDQIGIAELCAPAYQPPAPPAYGGSPYPSSQPSFGPPPPWAPVYTQPPTLPGYGPPVYPGQSQAFMPSPSFVPGPPSVPYAPVYPQGYHPCGWYAPVHSEHVDWHHPSSHGNYHSHHDDHWEDSHHGH